MLQQTDHDVETVLYLKNPPDRDTLVDLVAKLEDDPADLVRRDAFFKKLEIDPATLDDTDTVIDLLVEYPKLLQRPVIVMDDKAIVGRPKSRLPAWFGIDG